MGKQTTREARARIPVEIQLGKSHWRAAQQACEPNQKMGVLQEAKANRETMEPPMRMALVGQARGVKTLLTRRNRRKIKYLSCNVGGMTGTRWTTKQMTREMRNPKSVTLPAPKGGLKGRMP